MTDTPEELSQETKDEALALFVAATSGDASPAQVKALRDWSEQSGAHRREIEHLMALTRASRQLRGSFPLRPHRRPFRPGWLAAGLAAVVLALWLTPPVIVVADGLRPLSVPLGDGSAITLDAGARAEISRLPWPRHVRLTEGRALFDVTHDDWSPFIVQAGSTRLRDLGTRFLVELHPGETRIAVFEGEVQVDGGPALTAGRAAMVSSAGIAAAAAPDEEVAAGWSKGRLVFKDAPLSEVAALLSRYRPAPVRVEAAVAGLRVSGIFDLTQQGAVLRGLERVVPVRIRHDAAETVIGPRK